MTYSFTEVEIPFVQTHLNKGHVRKENIGSMDRFQRINSFGARAGRGHKDFSFLPKYTQNLDKH